jgi:hypothetical protein
LLAFIEQTALDVLQCQVGFLQASVPHAYSMATGSDPCWIWLSKLPVSRHRFARRITIESPITICLAAARAAAPPSTTWIARTRRSFEYPLC